MPCHAPHSAYHSMNSDYIHICTHNIRAPLDQGIYHTRSDNAAAPLTRTLPMSKAIQANRGDLARGAAESPFSSAARLIPFGGAAASPDVRSTTSTPAAP
eukprot:scpid34930/ scgid12108/ 